MMQWFHLLSGYEVSLFPILSPLTVSEGNPGESRVYKYTLEQKAGRVSLGCHRDGDWHTTEVDMASTGWKPLVLRACCRCHPLTWQEFCVVCFFFPAKGTLNMLKVFWSSGKPGLEEIRGEENQDVFFLWAQEDSNSANIMKIKISTQWHLLHILIWFFFYFAIWPIRVSFENTENPKVTSRSIYFGEATVLNDSSLNIY